MRKKTNSNIALKLLLSFSAAVLIILAPRFEAHANINLTGAPRSPNTDTQILLEWSPASGASYYELYRNGELLAERIEDTGANLSHIDGSLKILVPETRYNYEVRAFDEGGNELLAERESVSVVTTRMLQPSNLSYVYDINNGDITIRWKNNSLAAAGTSMGLLPGTGSSREVAYVYGKAEEHKLTGQNLVPGIIAEYTVTSYNEGKTRSSDPSTSIEVLPVNRPSLSVSASGNMVKVSWGDYACISNFNLQRRKLSGSTWTAWQNISTSLSGTSINDTLPSGGYYDYRLIAKGSYSGEVVYRYYYDGLSILVPPSNLKCTVSDTNKIFLTWTNNSDNYSRVELQRNINNGQFTTVERDIPKGADSYIDYGSFKENAAYGYRLVVYDEVNNSFISDECKITMSKPASPKNLQLTLVSGTRVDLSWSDLSDNELEFRVERKTGSGRFIEIDSTKENFKNYSDNGVSPGHTYTYRVRAYNYRGYSEYTNEAQIPSTALEPPNSLEVTAVSDRQINLKWTYPISGSQATVVERKTGAQGEWKTIAALKEGITQYSDTGLSDNTEYFYRLKIHINENARSIPYPDDNSGIGAVTFIGSTRLYADAVSSNRIRLEWSSRHKGMELVIERKTAFGDFVAIKTIESGTDRWYDEGVIPQAEYIYRIKVVDEDNEPVYSNEVTVVNSYLDEPEDLEVKVISKNEIKLTWVDASDSETGFEIWRYIYGYESYELYAAVGPNTTSFIDEDVQEGLQYYYKIRAISSLDDITSDFTPSVTTGVGIVSPPSDLKYTVLSDYRIKLTWKDNSDDESGFAVERKIGENGTWTEIAHLSKNSTTYTCTSLNPHVRYFFRVKAYKSSYNSDSYSDEIEVSTNKANAPENLTVTAISTGMVKLEWEDKAYNETGYEVERRLASGKYSVAAILDADVTGYTDKNLLPGKLYYYRVRAFNSAGYSDYTLTEHITTMAGVSFDDVAGSHWAKEAVESLASRGIIRGKSEKKFMPDDIITRAEFTALVIRAFDLSMTPVGSYKDVRPGNWHYSYIMAANALGIAVGDVNGSFYPDMPIIREDMAVMIVKALETVDKPLPGYSNSILEIFKDKNHISLHAIASIASLYGEGVMKGKGENTLAPKESATRAEAAVMLYRAISR